MEHGSSVKQTGAEFWNANPCGGDWCSYSEFLEWIRRTEPYAFDTLDHYDWADRWVIDVGCGQGTTLNYLHRFGATVVGVDMSLESLQRAKAGAAELGYVEGVHLVQADVERLPFEDARFDTAISFGVLHHTPDTAVGIRAIYRLLKPCGIAIVMLYRSGNPKWWMTGMLRAVSRGVDFVTGRPHTIAANLRARRHQNEVEGTALLELFGVPVLRAFSNRQARRLFAVFADARISNHQPGFRRLVDILPMLRWLERGLVWIDRRMQHRWGFYQVVEARK
jgi:SAM-dependent methyltransferase